jgi:LCP family protein required for cell wall assembly
MARRSDDTEILPAIAPAPEPCVTKHRAARRRLVRRRARRIALVFVAVIGLFGGAAMIGGWLYIRSVDSSIERVDVFGELAEELRPVKVAPAALNMLVLGSDSGDPDPDDDGARTDTIMLAHVPANRSSAQLISIPRDTWLRVPKSADGRHGGENAKINQSYEWGGVPLLVQTVESFTDVRIDHVAIIEFGGFVRIIDALGGIDIAVDRNFKSIHPPFRQFSKGKQHMDGETALDYARQRKQWPDGDFARIRHQQQLIKAVLDKAADSGMLTSPTQLNGFVRAMADAVTVDRGMSIVDMAMNLRHLRSGNITFLTSPVSGTGPVGDQSVVFADMPKARRLFDAVRRDAVAEMIAAAKPDR